MLYFVSFIAGASIGGFFMAIIAGNATINKIRDAKTEGYWKGWADRGKAENNK